MVSICKISARIPHPPLRGTFPPGEGITERTVEDAGPYRGGLLGKVWRKGVGYWTEKEEKKWRFCRKRL